MVGDEFNLQYKKSVEKDLKKLALSQRKAVVAKILALVLNPMPVGYVKIRGSDDLFRVRCGDYRIIYQIKDHELIILVIKVGHRREVDRDS